MMIMITLDLTYIIEGLVHSGS